MEWYRSSKNKTTKDKNGENEDHLEITEEVLVHCNVAKNDYQKDSRILYPFVPNKSICHLLEIVQKYFYVFKNI